MGLQKMRLGANMNTKPCGCFLERYYDRNTEQWLFREQHCHKCHPLQSKL